MKILKKLIRSMIEAFILLPLGITCLLYVIQPYKEAVTIGLSAFAILATFCGLCLRLSSALDDIEDKRKALKAGEKCFIALLLIVASLAVKVSSDIFAASPSPHSVQLLIKYARNGILIVLTLCLFIFLIDGLKDIGKLLFSRVSTWGNDKDS